MPSVPKFLPWSIPGAPDLLSQATEVLAREALRLPGAFGASTDAEGSPASPATPGLTGGLANLGGRTCPIVGAQVPLPGENRADLSQQAHQLVAGLFAAASQVGLGSGHVADHSDTAATPWSKVADAPGRACPVTKATLPVAGFDKDQLRRQAHEFIDTLLVTFRSVTSEDGVVPENKVPLIMCTAPVQAGQVARTTLTIANEEATPSEVSLYSTNFIGDSGYEIPSMRTSTSPRVASIPAHGQAAFEIRIAVPQQTPAGTYSGLLQATGSKYVKAVLSVQVL